MNDIIISDIYFFLGQYLYNQNLSHARYDDNMVQPNGVPSEAVMVSTVI